MRSHILKELCAAIVDSVFPPTARSEHAARVPAATLAEACTMRSLTLPDGTGGVACFSYTHADIRRCVQALKYDRARAVADTLATAVYPTLLAHIAEEHGYTESPIPIVPIPLSRHRLRERGHNQVRVLADALIRVAGPDVFSVAPALTRADRPSQTDVPRRERGENIAGAFTLSDESDVRGRRVILLDDTATTGSTLADATRALRAAEPAHILPVAIAAAG